MVLPARVLFRCTAGAVLLYGAILAITLLGNVRINSLADELAPNDGIEEFENLRANWIVLHHLRSPPSLVAFVLLAVAAVLGSATRRNQPAG